MTDTPHKPSDTVATPMPANIWLLGMRPRTLTMAAVPIVVGAVLAWTGGAGKDWVTFVVTLACAVLIQVGTNLFNDANDGERGADGPDRIGPLRITGSGLAQTPFVGAARTRQQASRHGLEYPDIILPPGDRSW